MALNLTNDYLAELELETAGREKPKPPPAPTYSSDYLAGEELASAGRETTPIGTQRVNKVLNLGQYPIPNTSSWISGADAAQYLGIPYDPNALYERPWAPGEAGIPLETLFNQLIRDQQNAQQTNVSMAERELETAGQQQVQPQFSPIPYSPASQAVAGNQPFDVTIPFGYNDVTLRSQSPMLQPPPSTPSVADLMRAGDVDLGADSSLARYMALAAPPSQGMGINPIVGGIPQGSGVIPGLKQTGSGLLNAFDAARENVGLPYLGSTMNIYDQARKNPLALANLLPSSNAANLLMNYGESKQRGEEIRESAYNASPGFGVGVDILTDPLTYIAPGALGKIGTRFPALKPATGLIEGVGPRGALPLAIGAAGGTELASRFDVPYIPEPLEQLLGGLGGGMAGLAAGGRGALRAPISSAVDEPQFPRYELPEQTRANLASAQTKLLDAARAEAALRRSGTVTSEIMAGRSRQAQAYEEALRKGIAEGLPPQEAAAAARRALAVGPLRETITPPVKLEPEELDALLTDLNQQQIYGNLLPFEHNARSIAIQKLINGEGLQPREVKRIREMFGDEIADAVKDRPLSPNQILNKKWRDLTKGTSPSPEMVEATAKLGNASIAERQIAAQHITRMQERVQKQEVTARLAAEKKMAKQLEAEAKAEAQLPIRQMEAGQADLWKARAAADFGPQEVGALPPQLNPRSEKARQAVLEAAARQRNAEVARAQREILDDISSSKTAEEAATKAAKAIEKENMVPVRQMRGETTTRTDNLGRTIKVKRNWRLRKKWRLIANDEAEREKFLKQPILDPVEQKIAARELRRVDQAFARKIEAVMRADEKTHPTYDRVVSQVQKTIDAIKDVDLRDAANATLRSWMRDTDRVLAQVGDDAPAIFRNISSAITGDVADSYLATALHRVGYLDQALRAQGLDEKIARKIAQGMVQYEVRRKYGRNLPAAIEAMIDSTKPEMGGAIEGAANITRELKNLQFGIGDMAVFGQQVLHGLRTGGPQFIVGLVNRMLLAAHIHALDVAYVDRVLPRKIAYQLDGVAQGTRTGITDIEFGRSILSRIPKIGEPMDRPLMKMAEKLTDFQFGTVLTGVRNLIYEGNMALAKVSGADVTDPAVRARAAAFANAATSAGTLAQRSGRASFEEAAALSPSMRRAQVQQLLRVAQGFMDVRNLKDPVKRTNAVLAATTVASWGAATLLLGKVIHDYYGADGTDFEMDPSKPGFGILTLPNGTSLSIFPQEQVLKAVARSFRILAEGEYSDLDNEWIKLGLSTQSPVVAAFTRSIGYGYEPGKGWALGDYGEGASVGQKVLNALPLPPIAGESIREGIGPELVPEFLGVPTFQGSPSQELARQYKAETGRDYWDDVQGDRESKKRVDDWINQDEARKQLSDESLRDAAEGGSEGAAKMIESEQARAARTAQQEADNTALLAGELKPDRWRENRSLRQAMSRAEQDAIFNSIESKEEQDAVAEYFDVLNAAVAPNGIDIDWEQVDRWHAQQSFRDRLAIERYTGNGGTDLEKEHLKAVDRIRSTGYWEVRDQVAAEFIKMPEFASILPPGVDTASEFEAEIRRQIRAELSGAGYAPNSAEGLQLEEQIRDKVLKQYDEVNTNILKKLRTTQPELLRDLIEWGYYPGSKESLRILLENPEQAPTLTIPGP